MGCILHGVHPAPYTIQGYLAQKKGGLGGCSWRGVHPAPFTIQGYLAHKKGGLGGYSRRGVHLDVELLHGDQARMEPAYRKMDFGFLKIDF